MRLLHTLIAMMVMIMASFMCLLIFTSMVVPFFSETTIYVSYVIHAMGQSQGMPVASQSGHEESKPCSGVQLCRGGQCCGAGTCMHLWRDNGCIPIRWDYWWYWPPSWRIRGDTTVECLNIDLTWSANSSLVKQLFNWSFLILKAPPRG